jgi:hypothetical protein
MLGPGGWGGVITFCVFVVFDLLRWRHFMSRWTRCTISLDTSTVITSLGTSSVLRCAHFMLRWTCLRYFGVHTSWHVGHVYCTSLRTSSVLRCANFMLRWTCLRYFGVHTTWHVGHVYCNSVYTLHVTLDTSTVLRCAHFMARWTRLLFFGGHTSCCVGHVYALWRNAKPSKRNVFWGCSTCILLVPTA